MRPMCEFRLSLTTLAWVAGLWLLAPGAVAAKDYLNESRTIAGPPQSKTEQFSFTLGKGDLYPYYDFNVQMSRGQAGLRIVGPSGRRLEELSAQRLTGSQPIARAGAPGKYTLEVTTKNAVGSWHLRVFGGPTPPKPPIGPGLATAAAMLVVAGVSVWFCRRRTQAAWRWFWVGAGLWTVAVAVKIAIAIPLNGPVMVGLKPMLPYWAYLTVGTIYGGAMTGLTEVLFVYLAGLRWRQMADTAGRAAAIGVGAGAFEAALLAIAPVVATLAAGEGAATWSVALAPAAERVIAILCHTASRMLALLAVAKRRWIYFGYGFLLLSGLDAVAMYLILTGQTGKSSPWIIEAMFAPFALVSIPIIGWCVRRWPEGGDATMHLADVAEHADQMATDV
jgi:uncharacterized membrane protein YhfC